ncbi:MAG: tRNA 2-thiouridine(34) synthase MnmA [bacterium]|nr:tRNA 2-thiouridine(34) synthase MnmA [bacterium]
MISRRRSVLIGMSGGVDSSVSAALLQDDGFDVIGATMKIWDEGRAGTLPDPRICCSLQAVEDALAVCDGLGIPYRLLEFGEFFKAAIVDNFCREYLKGRTPNPCIRCNTILKFDHFLAEARRLGCDFMATGHYARIDRDAAGKYVLKKGVDRTKDQSYFLYGVNQEVLGRLLFPVGDFTKDQVRQLARQYHLPVSQKLESQEICFIPDNDYAGFLKRRFPSAWQDGDIVDLQGRTIGKHRGYMHFTIGQRRGLSVAHAVPLYVVDIRPEQNVIVAGRKEDLLSQEARVVPMHWIAGEAPDLSKPVTAKIRYRHQGASAQVEQLQESRGCRVHFFEPQEAITPGQSLVLYDGEIVLGGGVIAGP